MSMMSSVKQALLLVWLDSFPVNCLLSSSSLRSLQFADSNDTSCVLCNLWLSSLVFLQFICSLSDWSIAFPLHLLSNTSVRLSSNLSPTSLDSDSKSNRISTQSLLFFFDLCFFFFFLLFLLLSRLVSLLSLLSETYSTEVFADSVFSISPIFSLDTFSELTSAFLSSGLSTVFPFSTLTTLSAPSSTVLIMSLSTFLK
uniref:Uncharacterized protein n=1 Tax=Cacopsylla melanoneura TaxID=428564 RepID=A0A8D8TVK4_9HEMI